MSESDKTVDPFLRSMELTFELHQLAIEAPDDDETDDAIRDELDVYRAWLSPTEITRVQVLSASLQSIRGRESYRNVPAVERTSEWVMPRMLNARNRGDWYQVLEILRNGPTFYVLDRIAGLRAQCYANLGFGGIALSFYRSARELAPHEPIYLILELQHLYIYGPLPEAVRVAFDILRKPEPDIRALVIAANIVFEHRKPSQNDGIELRALAEILRAKLRAMPVLTEFDQYVIKTGYLIAILCELKESRDSEANRVSKEALDKLPDDPELFVVRGVCIYKESRAEAIKAFTAAVQRGSRDPRALILVANDLLSKASFVESARVAETGIGAGLDYRATSKLLQILALANYGATNDTRYALDLLLDASALNPYDPEIAANFELLQNLEIKSNFDRQITVPHPELIGADLRAMSPNDLWVAQAA